MKIYQPITALYYLELPIVWKKIVFWSHSSAVHAWYIMTRTKLYLLILSKDIPLWCHKGTGKRVRTPAPTGKADQAAFSLCPHPSKRHFQRAPPPDVCRVVKCGYPIKGRKPPFDGAHKDGKPGRSWQLVGLAVDWLVWRADKWGDIWGGWRRRRSAGLAVWNGLSEGAGAKKRDVVATAVCWGREEGKKRSLPLNG